MLKWHFILEFIGKWCDDSLRKKSRLPKKGDNISAGLYIGLSHIIYDLICQLTKNRVVYDCRWPWGIEICKTLSIYTGKHSSHVNILVDLYIIFCQTFSFTLHICLTDMLKKIHKSGSFYKDFNKLFIYMYNI